MFTGIVEEIGEITAANEVPGGVRLDVRGPLVVSDAKPGDSISVNGVCLTVTDRDDAGFTVDVVAETVQRSSLVKAAPGQRVNLERAVAAGDRLGGHIVQGHVDGVGVTGARDAAGLTSFEVDPGLVAYLVEKGSVAVDGVSLTVVDVDADSFSVALIPTTLAHTTLGLRVPGDLVNIEVDVLAKYVHSMVGRYAARY